MTSSPDDHDGRGGADDAGHGHGHGTGHDASDGLTSPDGSPLTESEESRSDAPMPHPFAVPNWLDRGAAWSWRLLLVIAAVVVAFLAFSRLRIVIVPFLVAMLIAALLGPLAARLRRLGLPRLLATWVTLLGTLVVVGGVIGVATFLIADQLTGDTVQWQEIGDDIRQYLRDDSPFTLTDQQIDDLWARARDVVTSGVDGVGASSIRLVGEVLTGIFLGVVLTFFFVNEGGSMWRWVVERTSPRRADAIDEAGRRSVSTLGAYVRGLAVTGLVDGAIIGIGLFVLDVPLAIPLAIITFFGAFIPIVGATAAGALAVLVALATEGPTDALITGVIVLVVQQVEGDVVMPMVMRNQVRLHPAVILLAVTGGGALLGVIGAFLAVPIAAVIVEITAALRSATTRQTLTDGTPSG